MATAENPFQIFAYDFLSGTLLGSIPGRTLSFGQQLNNPGTATFSVDMDDRRVQAADPLTSTTPGRTFICVDYAGAIVWGGLVQTRRWEVTGGQSAGLAIQCSELWSYFQKRIQATDYSQPPASGLQSPMVLWPAATWDASLIACQIIQDALGNTQSGSIVYGNPLGGLNLRLNGAVPGDPVSDPADFITVTYPFPSLATVDTIVSQISQLGLGVAPDFGVDIAYSGGSGSPPVGTINLSYPRRGRAVADNNLIIDLTTARAYSFPEDATQLANTVYEVGGTGAIDIEVNVSPLDQGYALFEGVFSRSNIQSGNIEAILQQIGQSDLTLYSYPPVVPTVTLSVFDTNLPLGSFIVGDDVQLFIPQYSAQLDPTGLQQPFDSRFPAGLNQEWRIVQWQASIGDQGDATMQLTLNQPPVVSPVAPAV